MSRYRRGRPGLGWYWYLKLFMARLVMSVRQTDRNFKRTARSLDLGFGVCSNSLVFDVAFEFRVLTASSCDFEFECPTVFLFLETRKGHTKF